MSYSFAPVARTSKPAIRWGIMVLVALIAMPQLTLAQTTGSEGSATAIAADALCSARIDSIETDVKYIVATEEANLRTGPSTDCGIIAELERDTALLLIGELQERDGYTWAPVSSPEGNGFIAVQNLQEVPDGSSCERDAKPAAAGGDGFTSEAVNLRSGAGMGCAVIAKLAAGTPVQPLGPSIENDGETWLPVTTPFGDGYIVQEGYAAPGSWEQPVAVAVLMYHDLNDNYNRFVVAPWQLEQQLIWLRDNGYTSITPRDLIANLDHGAPLPPRPVILSVDDGWASTRIFRDLLTAYGLKGTYMLPNYAELTPEEIYQLNQSGEVCGHSVSHPFLDQLSYEGQWYEIVENKAWLDSITGTSTTCFAYPFGAFNDTTTQIVIDAGYQIGFHAWDGLQFFDYLDRWHITRIEVSGEWDLSTFASVVSF